jgi:hypothetical protein
MLSGELAYPDVTSKQSLVQRLTARPRPLAEVRPEVAWPPRLQEALDKALSPEPHDRYAKVGEFALDVVAATGAPAAQAQGRTRAMTPMGVRGITTESYEVVNARVLRRRPLVAAGAVVAAIGAVVLLWLSRTNEPVQGASAPVATQRSDSSVVLQAPAPPAAAPSVISPPVVVPDSVARVPEKTTPAAVTPLAGSRPVDAAGAAAPGKAADSVFTASGDSASGALPSGSVVDQAREVLVHINRARRLFTHQQVPKANAELRTAHEKLAAFAAEHPRTRETQMLRQQLRNVSGDALAACQAARDSAAVAGRRAVVCTPLERFLEQQTQMGRGGARPGNIPFSRRARP